MSIQQPIFVVGAPRTGTTLVRDVLNRHPRIHLFDEIHFFERLWDDRARLGTLETSAERRVAIDRLRQILRDFGTDQAVGERLTPEEFERSALEAGGGYRGLLWALVEAGAKTNAAEFGGDSSPQDVLYLDQIFEWFPQAKIVALIRDPRGFLGSYKNYYRRQVASYRERYNPLVNSLLWRSSMNAVVGAAQKPWGGAVLRFRYEDLVANPETEVRRLAGHVGVPFDPRMLEVERANSSFVPESETTKQRGIYQTSTDRWKTELSPTEIWIAERVTGPLLDEFGYPRLVAAQNIRPSAVELAQIATILPGRLFNMLFRNDKPFRMEKVRRVLDQVRGR